MTAERRDLDYLVKTVELLQRLLKGSKHFDDLLKDTLRNVSDLQSSVQTAFSQWVRKQPGLDSVKHGLSIHDIDFLIHQYKMPIDRNGGRHINNLMLIEEKRYGATSTDAQKDSFLVLDQLLQAAMRAIDQNGAARKPPRHGIPVKTGRKVINHFGRLVEVKYHGMHQLRFNRSGPVDSDLIEWDGKPITIERLEQLIRFDICPRTFKTLEYRRHHANKAAVTPLFDVQH